MNSFQSIDRAALNLSTESFSSASSARTLFSSVAERATTIIAAAKVAAEILSGVRKERLLQRIDRAELVLSEVLEAWKKKHSGKTTEEIASQLQRSTFTVQKWLEGSLPPEISRLAIDGARELPDLWPQERAVSRVRAHLLGLYQASSPRGGTGRAVQLQNRDRHVLEEIQGVLTGVSTKSLAPIRIVSTKGESSYALTIGGRGLAAELSRMTARNTKVPWQYLTTAEEQLSYLKGFLTQRGSFSGRSFMIESGREFLMVGIASLLALHEIVPTVSATSRGTVLQLSAHEELENLEKQKLLGGEKATELAAVLSAFPRHSLGVSRERYSAVMALKGAASIIEIARSNQVPHSLVSRWISNQEKPRSVQRMDEIVRLRRQWKLPDLDSIDFLFRRRDYPEGFAMTIATLLPRDVVRRRIEAALETLSAHGVDGFRNPLKVFEVATAHEQNRAVNIRTLREMK